MTHATEVTVTRLLHELELGDRAALDRLFPLVYAELHALAQQHRRRWQGDDTLGTTVLVHEAYLKLIGQNRIRAESRAHFLAVAARAMRHILINYARDRRTQRRGAHLQTSFADGVKPAPRPEPELALDRAEELVALDAALRSLEEVDARRSRVVECRFFGGMTIEETAAALEVSARTVKRDWAVAQAWLHRQMERLHG